MKHRLALALALLLLAAPVVAAEPVKITADNFTVDQGNKSGTFTGSVVITRTNLTIWANKVVVTYGKGGESDIDTITATGAVRIKTPAQEATGGRATFDPLTQILKLTENVTVLNAQGKVSGPELTINLASQTSTFEGGKGGRVTGVFTPQ
ncbi:MAG: lipopolysaccharide transport periplasmic protein LptA [Devosia sp.]|uniref:lipopolysaccharide transport periplasmic protein LptA n=1 Tax=Devosia sp. TaxID=1871048 RepID=UPI001ACBE81C|nr:lipopolysaccharide transport periplasmic protein LptA [Devosia sp.]MBN9308126.1 lipopolysaccharide transport periplasmic protein LptA [Devosia sp.]MBN9317568.1 lipopolysaccharide transport periplasmic protein LptA [Devosia sp.]